MNGSRTVFPANAKEVRLRSRAADDCNRAGAEGRVDMYLFPSVLLLVNFMADKGHGGASYYYGDLDHHEKRALVGFLESKGFRIIDTADMPPYNSGRLLISWPEPPAAPRQKRGLLRRLLGFKF